MNLIGVVTAPDKPAGRGKKINQSAVKQYCLSKQINLLQPYNLKDKEFVNHIQNLNPDLIVVVAFRMLTKSYMGNSQIWNFQSSCIIIA